MGMSLKELVNRAIFVAQVPLTPAGSDPIMSVDLQAEMLVPIAVSNITKAVAEDPHRKHLLTQNFQITLDSEGKGFIPDRMLSEYIDEGSVRDGDTSANEGLGNVLVRIHHFDDYVEWRDRRFGYYCLHEGRIWTRAINSGSRYDTYGPLSVDCVAQPSSTTGALLLLSDELTDDLVVELARLIRLGVVGA